MAFTINTNVSALSTYRNLASTQNDMSKSLQKLSTGLRINGAADDAAGLSISEGLKSQVSGTGVAIRNAQDGINVAQTADGTLGQVQDILHRMRDLAVQAANDSNNDDSRQAIKDETDQLTSELTRIGNSTKFNGINLLDGSANLNFQVGANGDTNSQIGLDLTGADIVDLASDFGTPAGTGFKVTAFDANTGAPTGLAASYSFTSTRSGDGASSSVDVTVSGPINSVQDLADALKADDDFASKFSVTVAKDTNGNGKGIIVTAKDGGTVTAAKADGTPALGGLTADPTLNTSSVVGLDFTTAASSQAAIEAINQKITDVSTQRSKIGAVQNRLEHAIKNLSVSQENLSASKSQITDTDMASEMANYTKQQIMSQAGTAMLAQANQMNQGVLRLLQ